MGAAVALADGLGDADAVELALGDELAPGVLVLPPAVFVPRVVVSRMIATTIAATTTAAMTPTMTLRRVVHGLVPSTGAGSVDGVPGFSFAIGCSWDSSVTRKSKHYRAEESAPLFVGSFEESGVHVDCCSPVAADDTGQPLPKAAEKDRRPYP
jgi:hypothetical protein